MRVARLSALLQDRTFTAVAMTSANSTREISDCARYPDNPMLQAVSDETRLVVSEPLGDLAGAWNEVPEASYGIIREGDDELHPFTPQPP